MKILLSKRAYAAALALLFIFMLALNFLTPYQADDFAYHFSFDTGERIESISDIFPSLAAHTQTMNGRVIAHFFVHLFELLPKAVFIDGTPELYLPGLYGCTRYSIAYEMPFPSPIDWVNSYMGQYYGVERIIGYDLYTDVFQDVKYLN